MAYTGWTVSSLACAYLDLILAYWLLCVATVVFFTTKLLALFGLGLPFSSFYDAFLFDAPSSIIDSLHFSLSSRSFPRQFQVELVGHDEGTPPRVLQGVLDKEEAELPSGSTVSYSSIGFPSAARNLPPPHPLRRCCGQVSPLSLSHTSDPALRCCSPSVTTELSDASDLNEVEKDGVSDPEETVASDVNLVTTVKNLESALEEERAARSALYLDLETERSAAASAADEAMAMILRLQKEKAAIEMDARQYQRVAEEKSVYDEEEMDILKEIIRRREREKHVLEKEVEEYQNIVFLGEEGSVCGVQGDWRYLMHHARHDPTRSFHMPTEFLHVRKLVGENKNEGGGDDSLMYLDIKNKQILSGDEKLGFLRNYFHEQQDSDDGFNMECQEKNMLTIASVQIQDTKTKETLPVVREGRERDVNSKIVTAVSFDGIHGEQSQDAGQTLRDPFFDTASTMLDVHVVNGNLNVGVTREGNEDCLTEGALCFPEKNSSSMDSFEFDTHNHDTNCTSEVINKNKFCFETVKGSSSMDILGNKTKSFDLRRSSTSPIESERHKLEAEVELLRKRLKIIQEGRERLTFSVEHREKEMFQLQLLEEIAHQLQAIRNMTESGRNAHEAALPPCKVKTKKRRCRSVPWELHT